MKILNFTNFAELNQLRLNMGANLVKSIGTSFIQKPLKTVKYHKPEANKIPDKVELNNTPPMYSKDESNPKIFHPIKN